jgi:drug/metabolite transporter (DMT)-like permease
MRIGPRQMRLFPRADAGTVQDVSDRLVLPIFVALWSSGYVVGAIAIEHADPLPLLAARFALASLVAVPLALSSGRWRAAPLGRLAVIGVLLQIVQFGGIYGGFALGVPAGLSALVMLGLSPLVTTALAVGSGQERGDARLWTGLAVGVAGVAISLAPELGTSRVGAGIGVTVLGMLGLAGGTVLQKRWVGAADLRVSVAVQSVTGVAIVAPAVAVFGGRWHFSTQLVLSVGWLAWGMGIATLLLLVHLLRGHAASTVGALLLVVPPVTALASALTLGEALHPASLAGMIVALTGVGAVLRREAGAPKASRPMRGERARRSGPACRSGRDPVRARRRRAARRARGRAAKDSSAAPR